MTARRGAPWSMGALGSTVPTWRTRPASDTAGGVAAAAAGLCWTVKAMAILATGEQPPLLFELAPVLMAGAVLVLGRQLARERPRHICTGVAVAALVASAAVLAGQVIPLSPVAYGVAMASANALVLVGLVVAGISLRGCRRGHLPLALGLVTLPALLVGGLVAEIFGERVLEVPLLALGIAWVVLGVELSRGRYVIGRGAPHC